MNDKIETGYVSLFTRYSKKAVSDANKGNLEQRVLETADKALEETDAAIVGRMASLSDNSNAQSNQQSRGVGLVKTLTKPGMTSGGDSIYNYQSEVPMTYGGANMETNQYRENAFINVVTLLAIIALIAVVAMVCVMIFPIIK